MSEQRVCWRLTELTGGEPHPRYFSTRGEANYCREQLSLRWEQEGSFPPLKWLTAPVLCVECEGYLFVVGEAIGLSDAEGYKP